MANHILPSSTDLNNINPSAYTLLYQDTACLTDLLQLSHQSYAKQSFLDEQAFVGFLRVLVQSIEAICEKNPQGSPDYDTYHLQFTHGIEQTFWQDALTAQPFFHAIACLVQCGIESFRVCQYPEGYISFLYNLELVFTNESVITAGKQRTAYLLLEQLRQKP